jgi:beta-glucosidase
MRCGAQCGASVPVAGALRAAAAGQWRTMVVPLRCFVRRGVAMNRLDRPFALTTAGRLTLSVSDVRIDSAAVDQDQCGAP